jgi:cytochrome c oxidase cbb3-type subunit 3
MFVRAALVACLSVLSASAPSCKPSGNDVPSSTIDAASSAALVADASTAPSSSQLVGRFGAPDAAPEAALDPVATVERGKMLYGRYCDFCHGKDGRGYAADQAPALGNDDLLAVASDDYLRDAIVKGRPGTTMSAWAVARGGPLSYPDASAIVAYLRTWQKRPSATLPARTANGSAERGAVTYAAQCASCHGAKGRDGKYNALANPELLAAANDAFLATSIEHGRAGTPMIAFSGKLSKEAIDDVVRLLRSWQKPPEDAPDLPPKPGALATVVLNPSGPQPPFDTKADFIPADVVKREYDRRATMIIIDARPPSDYARMHIAGAISVPFYQVAEYAKQIPKDRYVLTYCACPHAESVKVRDALRGLGYTKAAVIDEGMLAWRDRGYPVRGGAKP